MREQKSPQEDRPTAEGHRLGVPVPWLWVCLSPGDSLVYCTRYLSISWRHAARFLAGAVLDACSTPWQAATCEAPAPVVDTAVRVRPASPAAAGCAPHAHGARGPGREWTIVPSQCPACALEEEERSETSGTTLTGRLGRPQSSTYGRHVSVWGMSWVVGSHAVVLSAVSAVEERSRI